MTTILGDAVIRVRPDMSGVESGVVKGFRRIDVDKEGARAGRRFGAALKKNVGLQAGFGAALGTAATAGVARLAGGVKDLMSSSIDESSGLGESMSKVHTILGTAADGFINTADKIGLSDRAAADAVGTFGNLFTQLKLPTEQSAAMATAITTLGADFASFHNADISSVLDAQTAAFRGEYDAVQKFVPTLNAAAVQTEALRATGKKSVKDLTDQEKATATYALMLKGAGKASGDFARTEDSLANRRRIASAQWADIKAKIGAGLVPIISNLTSIVSTSLLPALSTMADFIGRNKDVIVPLVGAIGVFAGTVYTILTAQKAWTAVQAAFNIVMAANPIGLVIVGVAALGAALVIAYKKSETFRNIVNGAFQGVAAVVRAVGGAFATFGGAVARVFTSVVGKAASTATAVREKLSAIISFFREMPGKIAAFAEKVFNAAKGIGSRILGGIVDGVKGAAGVIGDIAGAIVGALKNFVNTQVIDRINRSLEFRIAVAGKGVDINPPDIPHLAAGGIVKARRGGTLALLGEGGRDEAVIPLQRGRGSHSGGGDVHYHVTVQTGGVVGMTKDDLRNYLLRELEALGRQGRVPRSWVTQMDLRLGS